MGLSPCVVPKNLLLEKVAPYARACTLVNGQDHFHLHTMACGGLREVQEALIVLNAEEIIDDEDFVYLYNTFSSRPVYPYWKFERFDENAWSDTECKTELRFELFECLEIPPFIICQQRTICNGKEGLYILLKRLAYPCRYTDVLPRFGRNPTELCLICNEVLDHIYAAHHHRLQSWNHAPAWGTSQIVLGSLMELCAPLHDHSITNGLCITGINDCMR